MQMAHGSPHQLEPLETLELSRYHVHIADVPFVVVDVETTGHSGKDHRVTEIACVVVRDGEIIDEFTSLVNPRQHIPSTISKITGITDAMVWNAPEAHEVFLHVRRLMQQPYSVFVAHNVSFDWSFVSQSFSRAGLPEIEMPRVCTYKLSKRLFPKQKKLNLGAVAEHLNVPLTHRHRAFGDASATAKVLIRLIAMLQEQHGVETLNDLLAFQNKRMQNFKAVPRSIERLHNTLKNLPDEPGVYYFRSQNDELLYIGKAKSLSNRVHSYFQPGAQHAPKIAELVKQVRDVQWKTTGTELSALLLESKEIKTHQPRYNTAIKRYRRYPFLRLGGNAAASASSEETLADDTTLFASNPDPFPRLSICFEVAADGAEYFGPFGSRGAAEAVLETINRSFHLRKCADDLAPNPAFSPCLYHQIGRCGAPCAALQTPEEYAGEVERVRKFLSGEREGIITVLRQAMQESSEQLAFEDAALKRNQLKEVERIFFRQQQISSSVNDNNVILILPTAERYKKVEVFFIRHGRLQFQRLVTKKLPIREFQRHIEAVYFDGSTKPPYCRKKEIDEIRIIASWIYQHRADGLFVYTNNLQAAQILDALTDTLYEALTPPETRIPFEEPP